MIDAESRPAVQVRRPIPFDPTERHEYAHGGYQHHAWVVREAEVYREQPPNTPSPAPIMMSLPVPFVALANEMDSYYVQAFRDRVELEAFVAELRSVADEAWGASAVGDAPACCDSASDHLEWFDADEAYGPPAAGWMIDRDGAPVSYVFTFCPFCGAKLPDRRGGEGATP